MTEVVRAFELPLQHADAETWPLLRRCWTEAAHLSNWCVTELLRRDVTRMPDMKQLPAMPEVDLYALAFGREKQKSGRKDPNKVLPVMPPSYAGGEFFAGAKLAAASIMTKVRKKYVKERLNVLWHRNQCPASYGDRQPWPVAKMQLLKGWLDGNGRPCVTVVLPGGQAELRLRGGPEFGRQMAHFKRMLDHWDDRLELIIRPQRRSNSYHRRGNGDDRIMVKFVARLPVTPAKEGRTLVLLTDPEAFWVAEIDGRRAWVLNADHLRRGTARHAAHLRMLQRMSEDAKAESRLHSGRAKRQLSRLEALCVKHRNRMASWTHETAAHLAGFCRRQGVGEVFYLDADQGFIPRFPWYELREKLSQKLAYPGEGVPSINFYAESMMILTPEEIQKENDECPEKVIRAATDRLSAMRRLLGAADRRKTGKSHPRVTKSART